MPASVQQPAGAIMGAALHRAASCGMLLIARQVNLGYAHKIAVCHCSSVLVLLEIKHGATHRESVCKGRTGISTAQELEDKYTSSK